MFLLPAENGISKKNPPYLTVLLILINVWVFYFLQGDGAKVYSQAIQYYHQSELLDEEKDAFYDYLLNNDIDSYNNLKRFSNRLSDRELISYIIIRKDFAQHIESLSSYSLEWRNKRQKLEDILQKDFTNKYLLKNYSPNVIDALVAMFMHADHMHLFFNMLFLFLFGFNLELLMGRGKTLFLYLLSGFGAAGFYIVTSSTIYGSSLGASGAVSGLMGGFCGWYGLKNIRYFYWLFVVFDYIKLPAALVFIYFLAKEYIMSAISDDNVAYMAHFGGLVAGFVVALVFKHLMKPQKATGLEATEAEKPVKNYTQAKYEEACLAFQQLDFEKARMLFSQLIEKDPHNIDYYTKLFALEKINPESQSFEELCNLVILRSLNDPRFEKFSAVVVDEIISNGRGLKRLPAETLIDYATNLVKKGKMHEAKPIINFVVKHYDFHDKTPKLLFQFGLGCEKQGDHTTYKKVFTYLSKKHPESFVGEEAKKALSSPDA